MFFILKLAISAAVIAGASELAKRQSFWGAILVSLPLSSLLSILWLYFETQDNHAVAKFSWGILVLVPLSLVFFVPFILQPKTLFPFWVNMGLAVVLTAVSYFTAQKLSWI